MFSSLFLPKKAQSTKFFSASSFGLREISSNAFVSDELTELNRSIGEFMFQRFLTPLLPSITKPEKSKLCRNKFMKNFFVSIGSFLHQSPSREDFSLCSCNQYSITSPEESSIKNNAYRGFGLNTTSPVRGRRYQNIFSRFSYFDHMLFESS